jgi:hypothetical protein
LKRGEEAEAALRDLNDYIGSNLKMDKSKLRKITQRKRNSPERVVHNQVQTYLPFADR